MSLDANHKSVAFVDSTCLEHAGSWTAEHAPAAPQERQPEVSRQWVHDRDDLSAVTCSSAVNADKEAAYLRRQPLQPYVYPRPAHQVCMSLNVGIVLAHLHLGLQGSYVSAAGAHGCFCASLLTCVATSTPDTSIANVSV